MLLLTHNKCTIIFMNFNYRSFFMLQITCTNTNEHSRCETPWILCTTITVGLIVIRLPCISSVPSARTSFVKLLSWSVKLVNPLGSHDIFWRYPEKKPKYYTEFIKLGLIRRVCLFFSCQLNGHHVVLTRQKLKNWIKFEKVVGPLQE